MDLAAANPLQIAKESDSSFASEGGSKSKRGRPRKADIFAPKNKIEAILFPCIDLGMQSKVARERFKKWQRSVIEELKPVTVGELTKSFLYDECLSIIFDIIDKSNQTPKIQAARKFLEPQDYIELCLRKATETTDGQLLEMLVDFTYSQY
jgi:hypothetical protein